MLINKLRLLYRQYWLARWLWWLGIVIPGVPFVLISLALLVFMQWPRDYQTVDTVNFTSEVEYLTLSAHGVKDTPKSWSDELQKTFAQTLPLALKNVHLQHVSLNWQAYSDNVFMCSVAGKNIGHELGNKLAKIPNLKGVHLIGHSCGSFVVLGLCESLKQQRASVMVQTTYLDPVSVYSGIFWHYGLDHFGGCADFSDTYIDTEDTVPGSNQALVYSYTFDVTQERVKRNLDYAPHAWPPIFYLEAVKKNQVPIYFKSIPDFTSYQKNTLITWQ